MLERDRESVLREAGGFRERDFDEEEEDMYMFERPAPAEADASAGAASAAAAAAGEQMPPTQEDRRHISFERRSGADGAPGQKARRKSRGSLSSPR